MSRHSHLQRSMETVDEMPPDLRACVHEYGLPIVRACLDAGVRQPNRIHQLVREIWEGARNSMQGRRPPGDMLDWLLIQAGASITAAQLGRVLHSQNLLIVPRFPTNVMVEASLATVANHGLICSKREKHRLRLAAALAAEPNYVERVSRRGVG